MHSSTPRASCVITSKDGQHTIVEDGQRTIVSGRPAGARGLEEPEYSGRRAARSISIGLEEPMEMETMEVAALGAGRPQKALITGNRTGSQEHWEPGALGARSTGSQEHWEPGGPPTREAEGGQSTRRVLVVSTIGPCTGRTTEEGESPPG
jgi:hypothetical protein